MVPRDNNVMVPREAPHKENADVSVISHAYDGTIHLDFGRGRTITLPATMSAKKKSRVLASYNQETAGLQSYFSQLTDGSKQATKASKDSMADKNNELYNNMAKENTVLANNMAKENAVLAKDIAEYRICQ